MAISGENGVSSAARWRWRRNNGVALMAAWRWRWHQLNEEKSAISAGNNQRQRRKMAINMA